jgi:ribosomal protein S18 acetylase RimI-like enzyme
VSSAPAARASGASVRFATWADANAIARTLGHAFLDDPVLMYFLPDERTRAAKLPRLFRMLFKLGLPHGACYVTGGCEAVTLWRPPDRWHLSFWEYILNGPELLGIFGAGALNAMTMMDRIEKVHPKKPHWYLQTIGTEPAMQGKGYGSLIMRDRLAATDAASVDCYLESSKITNIPIYKSFGFEVTGEIKIPNGPTLWPMWRNAR